MLLPGHMLAAPAFVMGLGLGVNAVGSLVGHPALLNPGEVVAAAVLSIPFSAGPLSPDGIERLFGLDHRYGVHWYGYPLLVIAILLWFGAPLVALGPVLGWLSHIWPADWLFGKGGRDVPRGIPAWPIRPLGRDRRGNRPRGKRYGVDLRVTANTRGWRRIFGKREHSVLEYVATFALLPILAFQLWTLGAR